eukprot:PhF_6_TR30796/c0_g1_i1/m.45344
MVDLKDALHVRFSSTSDAEFANVKRQLSECMESRRLLELKLQAYENSTTEHFIQELQHKLTKTLKENEELQRTALQRKREASKEREEEKQLIQLQQTLSDFRQSKQKDDCELLRLRNSEKVLANEIQQLTRQQEELKNECELAKTTFQVNIEAAKKQENEFALLQKKVEVLEKSLIDSNNTIQTNKTAEMQQRKAFEQALLDVQMDLHSEKSKSKALEEQLSKASDLASQSAVHEQQAPKQQQQQLQYVTLQYLISLESLTLEGAATIEKVSVKEETLSKQLQESQDAINAVRLAASRQERKLHEQLRIQLEENEALKDQVKL